MSKLLLALLTWMMLAGVSRAEETPTQHAHEPGNIWVTVKQSRKIVCRITGRVLGCLVVEGMDQEQVREILGEPCGINNFPPLALHAYPDLGVFVTFQKKSNAAGDRRIRVMKVSFCDFLF